MKKRLDIYLVENNFFESREKARAMIMAGNVYINNQKIDKPGSFIKPEDNVKIIGPKLEFVSRGGLKLKKAIEKFNIDLKNKICVDIGASTGGFTDCMLQNGAKKVFAIDVGYGQLAWKLRTDERVKVVEKVNVKSCTVEEVYKPEEEKAEFITMDLSFISITKVLENVLKLTREKNFEIVSLIDRKSDV